MADNIRHAIARSTGATTYAAKGKDGWTVRPPPSGAEGPRPLQLGKNEGL